MAPRHRIRQRAETPRRYLSSLRRSRTLLPLLPAYQLTDSFCTMSLYASREGALYQSYDNYAGAQGFYEPQEVSDQPQVQSPRYRL